MRTTDNIVQVEFFHIGGTSATLDALLEEALDRIVTCSPLKTVLRFEDIDGSLTLHALESTQQYRQLRAWEKTILRMKPGWSLRFNDWCYRRRIRSYERHKDQLTTLCANAAITAFKCKRTVAVEYLDHRFRMAMPNEHHELIERIRKAESAWVFVFRPNELCSDQHLGVVSVM